MSIGVLLRGFIGDMMDFGDVILYTLFPSFMTIQACTGSLYEYLKVPTSIALNREMENEGDNHAD
jgi:hypothetical protein